MTINKKPRPKTTSGPTSRMETGCGHLYVTVNRGDDGELFEVFAHLGKAGGCSSCQCEAITRLISLSMRCGVPAEEIIRQLRGLRCANISGKPEYPEAYLMSCPEAIVQAILREKEAHDVKLETQA